MKYQLERSDLHFAPHWHLNYLPASDVPLKTGLLLFDDFTDRGAKGAIIDGITCLTRGCDLKKGKLLVGDNGMQCYTFVIF